MAGLLAQRFRESVSKLKDFRMKSETEFDVGYSTGFLTFDFANGTMVHVRSNTKDMKYHSVGITDGSMVMVIGRSGCGKTTFCIQSASNIVRPFKTSCVFEDNIEGGLTATRRATLSRFNSEELKDRFICRNSGITAENFYERVKMIHDLKINNRADYEYDTGLCDDMGNRIYKLEPTVYILDSIALLMPEKYTEEDELSGQMAATAAAKANTAIFKRIIPMLKAANIILFVINHITQNVSLNAYAPPKSQVSYLKQGERLAGGEAIVYLSNLLLRFEDRSKLKDDEGLGINGSIVDILFVKSRTNRAGKVASLVFNQEMGYDEELSEYLLLKNNGKIGGAGAYLYITGHTDMKFAQKNFKEKLHTDPEFAKVFYENVIEVLMTTITDTSDDYITDTVDTASIIMSKIREQEAA